MQILDQLNLETCYSATQADKIPSEHMSRSSFNFRGTVFFIFSRQPETNCSYNTKLGLKLPALVEALDGADDASERENICIGYL